MKKVSLIITVLNEEKSIDHLLKSISDQIIKPDEVIIVDGGSEDHTVAKINYFIQENNIQGNNNFEIKVFGKNGNRSVGRNYAIMKARNEWIAITDAGCILDKNWLKELVVKQVRSQAKVIAGYYQALSGTSFQEAVVPYVLVMPKNLNENKFLPATRSLLLKKEIWKNVGGFDEMLGDNEDYVFAKKIVASKITIAFARKALVNWIPCSNLKDFCRMIFRFARGDVYAGIIRPKVLLIFIRYLFGFLLLFYGFINLNFWILYVLLPLLITGYILWSILKNYTHLSRVMLWFPVLQISSDFFVIYGSIAGLIARIRLLK
ncbi:MAG: glycosyltransferase [Pseudomonadales bacterium]|nr:glycosyltransferase [Pseudomonadales bacterium]